MMPKILLYRTNYCLLLKLNILFFLILSCKNDVKKTGKQKSLQPIETKKDSIIAQPKTLKKHTTQPTISLKDTSFTNIKTLSNDFVLDLKYATTDNFLNQKVYDCPQCLVRTTTAKALVKANQDFIKQGYKLKLFDCYRPLDVQKKMWKILPGTKYVANPAKGSKHNKGAAVDLTLVDSLGNELDMGTKFDFFGPEAHHNYLNHSTVVLANRKLLKETLAKYNFKSIYNEWWHYEFRPERNASVSNFKWECD